LLRQYLPFSVPFEYEFHLSREVETTGEKNV